MELISFIQSHPDTWREILSVPPYNLIIKEDEECAILVYSSKKKDTDFSIGMVRDARGIIIRLSDFAPVCVPFSKFFNVQETLASSIDWATARVQEKVDGSYIKVWFDNYKWHISTNGMINAFSAELKGIDVGIPSYGDLFIKALSEMGNSFEYLTSKMDKQFTYMFELVSPFNKIIVPYNKTEIYHIGTRCNIGYPAEYVEVNHDIGIQKPKEYALSSLDECLAAAVALPFSEEGYVVVDSLWNRVKIKSPSYVAVQHMTNNGVVTREKALEIILAGEMSEFLSYYPEYGDALIDVERKYDFVLQRLISDWDFAPISLDRKEFADWAKHTFFPSCMFALYDTKYGSPKSFLESLRTEKILELMERL